MMNGYKLIHQLEMDMYLMDIPQSLDALMVSLIILVIQLQQQMHIVLQENQHKTFMQEHIS